MLALSPSRLSITVDDEILGHDHVTKCWMVSSNISTDHSSFNIDHAYEKPEKNINASADHEPYFQFPDSGSNDPPPHHVPAAAADRIPNDEDFCPKFTISSLSAGEHPLRVYKKLIHNANERDRRKKLNGLYSSLRSTIPGLHSKKKLSIPATVSHVLKYIPELRDQIESLKLKKEEMLSKISGQFQGDVVSSLRRNMIVRSSSTSNSLLQVPSPINISARQVGDREVAIQICSSSCYMDKNGQRRPSNHSFSAIAERLENHGFRLLNAASFSLVEGRVFHNLHLQVKVGLRIECVKLLSFCWNILEEDIRP